MKKVYFSCLLLLLAFAENAYSQMTNVLKLTLTNGLYSDETIVRFLPDATDEFDSNWDAYKLLNSGNTPNLYSTISGVNYSINALYEPYLDKTLQLQIQVASSGTYAINFQELGVFDSTVTIHLFDQSSNELIDIKSTPSYSFNIQTGSDLNRFLLIFKNIPPSSDNGNNNSNSFSLPSPVAQHELINANIKAFAVAGKVIVEIKDFAGSVEVGLIDASGNEIMTAANALFSGSTHIMEFDHSPVGVCFVKVTDGVSYFTGKLLLME